MKKRGESIPSVDNWTLHSATENERAGKVAVFSAAADLFKAAHRVSGRLKVELVQIDDIPDFDQACDMLEGVNPVDFPKLKANAKRAKAMKVQTPLQRAITTFGEDLLPFLVLQCEAMDMFFTVRNTNVLDMRDFNIDELKKLSGFTYDEITQRIREVTLREFVEGTWHKTRSLILAWDSGLIESRATTLHSEAPKQCLSAFVGVSGR